MKEQQQNPFNYDCNFFFQDNRFAYVYEYVIYVKQKICFVFT
jgi:hypothetical protein